MKKIDLNMEKDMGNSLYSERYKKFLKGIGNNDNSINDIIKNAQESVGLIAGDLNIGRLETIVSSKSNPVERVGYSGQSILYQSKDGYEPDLHSMEFQTASGVVVVMNAYPVRGHRWDDEEKDDLMFVCASFFSVLEKARMKSILDNAAFTESMTGALNINGIIKVGLEMLEKGTLKDYTVAFFNIKNFKFLNGNYGIDRGNMVLRGLVDKIFGFLVPDEQIGRLGADNFVVLVKNERVDVFLDYLNPEDPKSSNESSKIEISFRIGLYKMQPEEDAGTGVSKANTALRETRKEGNSDIVWFTEDLLDKEMNAKKSTFMFNQALQAGEFVVYYQPKVGLNDSKLSGGEALVRWLRDGRVIPPMEFIPALEQDGSICALDMYVFDTVCRDIRTWIDAGVKPVKISSNFSKHHIKDDGFATKILTIVDRYGIDPKYLEIELTESACFEDTEKITKFLKAMKERGISVSIDDFGTGYSSLSLLRDQMVDVIKLDQSFIKGIQDEDESKAGNEKVVIKNIINMVEELNMKIIAEGVETDAAAEFLKNVNCDMAQGFLYDRPMSHTDFDVLLHSARSYAG